MGASTLAVAYLAAAVLFILGLKGLASPRTARAGNVYAMAGMALAALVTLASPQVGSTAGSWPASPSAAASARCWRGA